MEQLVSEMRAAWRRLGARSSHGMTQDREGNAHMYQELPGQRLPAFEQFLRSTAWTLVAPRAFGPQQS